MGHPLGRPGRIRGVEHQTLHAAWSLSEEGWQLYPVYAVDDEGTCACPKGPACPDPGKHPTTPHGFNDASSDPERIAEMFARWPGENVGLKTGSGSGTIIIDVDPRNGGMETLARLQAEHGYLPPTRLHATGGGGFHYALRYPEGVVEVPSRTIGPGMELKGDRAGVVLPPSTHSSGGRYEVLINAPLVPLPSWVVEIASRELRVLAGGGERPTESRFELPERIVESSPSRNRILFDYGCSLRAHGWDPAAILAALRRVNAERCIPPMPDDEVRKIARSAASYTPGNASVVAPEVRQAIAWLAQKAQQRFRRGLGAYSRWAVYRAMLICALAHGWMIGDRAVAVRISVRELRKAAGLGSKATLHAALKALKEARLVYRVSSGEGTMPGVLALRLPQGYKPEPFAPPSSAPSTGTALYPSAGALGALHQLRHGYGLGKLAGDVLERIVECPGVSRQELAARLGPGRKPETLKRPLKELREAGLVENRVRGRYWPVEGWQHVLDRVRTMSGEKLAENLAQRRDERECEAYRRHLAEKEESSEG